MASPSDKQDSVITTLLVQHNLDTGPVNVAKAQYNLDRYCEFGFTGPGDSTEPTAAPVSTGAAPNR